MDNTSIYNPNLFPTTPTVGTGDGYPKEDTSLNNPGSAPQLPWTIGSGVTRGEQTIAGTQTISNADGSSIVLGAVPNSTTNEFGITLLDKSGNIIQKILGGTTYYYDPSNSYVNSFISGILPDGTSGFVSAKPGISAASLFS